MTSPTKSDNYKWLLLGLVWVTYFLQQGTRQMYGAMLPQIKKDFLADGVTDLQLGLVVSVFVLVYAFAVPFAGITADLFRRKWVLVSGTLMFSVGIFISGFATTIGLLLITYGILNAVGQSMIPSPSTSLIAQFHTDTRSTALSIYQMALYIGIVICSCVSGWVSGLSQGSWRWAFLIFGAFGILWFFVLLLFLRDTPSAGKHPDQKKIPESEDAISTGGSSSTEPIAVKKATFLQVIFAILSKPSFLFMTLAFGMCLYGANGYKTWMTKYMADSFTSLTPTTAAFHAVFWFFAGALFGIAIASRISDRVAKNRPGFRMEMNFIGLTLAAPFVFLVVYVDGLTACCAALFFYGMAQGVYDSNFFAAIYDVIEPRFHAAATGIFCCGAFIIGSSAPPVLGWIANQKAVVWERIATNIAPSLLDWMANQPNLSMKVGFASLAIFYLIGAGFIAIARVFFLKKDFVK
ncbi:MAG: MFS transporter [Planctomycetia bacterium]|nr:MFS transporter [Planctomycetia bacterium]